MGVSQAIGPRLTQDIERLLIITEVLDRKIDKLCTVLGTKREPVGKEDEETKTVGCVRQWTRLVCIASGRIEKINEVVENILGELGEPLDDKPAEVAPGYGKSGLQESAA